MRVPKPMHVTERLSFTGAVDADGHILEPPDLWETYLEREYRDRALRLVPDEAGLEELQIGGERSRLSRRGFPSTLGAMGDPDLRGMQLDRFMWASDFPHADHTPAYITNLDELAGALEEPSRRRFLGDNVRALYGID